ncbi:hypothetical protein GCM10009668_14710 [Nocardioides dubius]|uniref:Uncharacterized protein n=1 Tax=Nocardioides dubius TaxID=317019 RepID=A0ABP4ECR8_9ACTN
MGGGQDRRPVGGQVLLTPGVDAVTERRQRSPAEQVDAAGHRTLHAGSLPQPAAPRRGGHLRDLGCHFCNVGRHNCNLGCHCCNLGKCTAPRQQGWRGAVMRSD